MLVYDSNMPHMILLVILATLAAAALPTAAAVVVLRRRGPRSRRLRRDAAIVPALLWWLAAFGLGMGLAALLLPVHPELDERIGFFSIGIMMAVATPPWLAVLFVLGAAAGRIGGGAMHAMMGAMAMLGVLITAGTLVLIAVLVGQGVLPSSGSTDFLALCAIPVTSALIGLIMSFVLRVPSAESGSPPD